MKAPVGTEAISVYWVSEFITVVMLNSITAGSLIDTLLSVLRVNVGWDPVCTNRFTAVE